MNTCRMCHQPVAPSAKACPTCGASDPNIGDFRTKTIIQVGFCFLVAAVCFTIAKANTGGWKAGFLIASFLFIGAGFLGLRHSVTGKDV